MKAMNGRCLTRFEELQREILECDPEDCPYKRSWDGQSIPEHELPRQWCWWFENKFPCYSGVRYTFFRYDGRSSVVFITLRPSTGWGIDTADFIFANALRNLGLVEERFKVDERGVLVFYEGALVTDLIKCRGKAGEALRRVHYNCLGFLKREIEIVRECSGREPKIVAVGKSGTRDLLWRYRRELGKRWKSKRDIPCISHPRSALIAKRRYEAFRKYLQEMSGELSRHGIV